MMEGVTSPDVRYEGLLIAPRNPVAQLRSCCSPHPSPFTYHLQPDYDGDHVRLPQLQTPVDPAPATPGKGSVPTRTGAIP